LGIALIVLLGFFVYHYRPKKLETEIKFKNALLWSEWGKRFYIGQSMLTLGIMSLPSLFIFLPPLFQSFLDPRMKTEVTVGFILWLLLQPFSTPFFLINPDAVYTAIFAGIIFLPLFFSWLIHRKLVKPLSEDRIPSKKTFHLLFGTGLFYVILFGTFIVGTVYTQGISTLLRALFIGIPFFLSMFIAGVLAIGIAGHELKISLTARSQNK